MLTGIQECDTMFVSDWNPLMFDGFFVAEKLYVNRRIAPVSRILHQTVRRLNAAGSNPPRDRRYARSKGSAMFDRTLSLKIDAIHDSLNRLDGCYSLPSHVRRIILRWRLRRLERRML
jgi:hypothetical protein